MVYITLSKNPVFVGRMYPVAIFGIHYPCWAWDATDAPIITSIVGISCSCGVSLSCDVTYMSPGGEKPLASCGVIIPFLEPPLLFLYRGTALCVLLLNTTFGGCPLILLDYPEFGKTVLLSHVLR